jgi:transposase
MNTETVKVHRVERVDDIPVLLATLEGLKVAEILDRHFPSGHRWKGELTFGDVACVWLAFITSQGDHRLNQVQPWVAANLYSLQACLGKTVRPLDFQDDRLADMLDRLAVPGSWQDAEADVNQHTVRVYNLDPRFCRVDTSTANSYAEVVDEHGYIQFGHSKDRDDLPQIKIPLTTLDPFGLPLTTTVVPGNCADDPVYVPEIRKVQDAFGTGGKTFVMDCKGAALHTRAYLASSDDYYLCPVPQTQIDVDDRRRLLQSVWQGEQQLEQVCVPAEEGESPELVAEGFFHDVVLHSEVDDRQITWTERRWVVRSLAFAAAQQKQLEKRLNTAEERLTRLGERKQGKKRLTAKETAVAAEQIVKEQRVEDLLHVQVKTSTQQKKIRGYGDQPARVVKEQEHRVEVMRCEGEIEQAKREMGWRVYAENQLTLTLEAVVWGYRGQNRLEGNYARLKGQPLGLPPMFLQHENRIVGLVLLLSLALRLLSLLEWTVRKKLQENKQTLTGLYAGQPGRKTASPSTELLLKAFKGISLVIVETAGKALAHVLPLTTLQQKLLDLWELPANLYQRLSLHFPEPPPI